MIIKNFARRLRDRAKKDEDLATSKCNQIESFKYVMGRAMTLMVIAEELEALDENPETVVLMVTRTELESLRRDHGRDCETLDANHKSYFGPSDHCSCGAREHNTKLDAILK